MRVLISNDDGIQARGLQELVRALKDFVDLTVVAPDREQSASSHSLTLHRPLRITKVKKNHYAVNGTPTDCVTLGINEIMSERPDLIISGINCGANLGDDVHYSGTVSAAMEGAIHEIPSIAVSLAFFDDEKPQYATAAAIAVKFCRQIKQKKLPKHCLFNVNVPNLSEKKLKGIAVTCLGRRNYGEVIIQKTDPRGRDYYWIGGDQNGFYDISGSDCEAIAEGKVSITPLKTDLTNRQLLKEMQQWNIG